MQKEAKEVKKQIERAYTSNINKGASIHNKQKAAKENGRILLEKSFSVGRVMFKESGITTAVTSRAPHYHPVEDGHMVYSHGVFTGKRAEGKKIVATIMARRSRDSAKIGQEVIDKIIKEARWN